MMNSPSLSTHPSPNVSSIGSMVSSLCPSSCTTSKCTSQWNVCFIIWIIGFHENIIGIFEEEKTNQTPLFRFFANSMMDGWLDKMQNFGSERKKMSAGAPFHLIEILIKFRWTYSKKKTTTTFSRFSPEDSMVFVSSFAIELQLSNAS